VLTAEAAQPVFDHDPAIGAKLATETRVAEVYIQSSEYARWSASFPPIWVFTLDRPYKPAAALACKVFYRAQDREWLAGELLADPHAAFRADPAAPLDLPDGTTELDVIFRPSVEVARQSERETCFWGEEMVFRNVPATDMIPATQPATP
jgi:hypothetical protein